MNEKVIRRPIAAALFFLYFSLSNLYMLFMPKLMSYMTGTEPAMHPLVIVKFILWFATYMFICIVLFAKKYNNATIAGLCLVMTPNVLSLFGGITPSLIIGIIFDLLLALYAYVTIKKPDTHLRETVTKLRFIFPTYQFIAAIITTADSISAMYDAIQKNGYDLITELVTYDFIAYVIPIVILSLIPVLGYTKLVNWLSDPYKKIKDNITEQPQQVYSE